MVENQLRAQLTANGISAAELARRIPGMDKLCMHFIEKGVALPTRDGMTVMCDALGCLATDLYDEAELNLNVTAKSAGQRATESLPHSAEVNTETEGRATIPLNSLEATVRQKAEQRDKGHEGQERLFFWFKPEEKAALVKAVKGLGYRSVAEWMREMYRQTLKQYAALGLEGKTLHDLIPPYVDQEYLPLGSRFVRR